MSDKPIRNLDAYIYIYIVFIKLVLGCLFCDWENSFRCLRGIFNVLLQTMKKKTNCNNTDKGRQRKSNHRRFIWQLQGTKSHPTILVFFPGSRLSALTYSIPLPWTTLKLARWYVDMCNPTRNELAWKWQVLDLNLDPGFQLLTAYTAKISTVLKSVWWFAWWHMPAQKWTKGRI